MTAIFRNTKIEASGNAVITTGKRRLALIEVIGMSANIFQNPRFYLEVIQSGAVMNSQVAGNR